MGNSSTKWVLQFMPFFWTLTHFLTEGKEIGRGACLESGEPSVVNGVKWRKENPWYLQRGLGVDCSCPYRRGMSSPETSYWAWSSFEIQFSQGILEMWESVDKSAYLPFSAPTQTGKMQYPQAIDIQEKNPARSYSGLKLETLCRELPAIWLLHLIWPGPVGAFGIEMTRWPTPPIGIMRVWFIFWCSEAGHCTTQEP